MSKPCKEAFKHPSYECYKNIKYHFVDKLEKSVYIDPKIVKFVEKYTRDELNKLNELPDVFNNLKKYLSTNHVFILTDTYYGQGICDYISYLLYNGIRNKKGSCDENTFNVFKKFVDEYNDTHRSNICNNMLNHVDYKKFKKMKDLYQLYDKYNYLFSTLWLWDQVPKYCEDVLFLVGLYNSFLNEFKSDSIEFNNILKKFGELMKTITIPGETNCKVRYSIGELHLYEPPVEKTHHHDNTSLGPETRPTPEGILDNAHNPISQEVVSSSSMSIREQDRRDTENSHRSEESDPSKLAATLVLRESVGRRQPHENLEHSDPHESSRRQQSFVSRGPYGPGGYYEQVEYREAQETFPPEEDSYSGTKQLEGHLPGKENAGFMTNVQSAISGFMNGVDPVPVVGVSGGMGALFLLFRYTPVGSFFRGGRGRARRIPGGFSGHFAGGIPGYEEFYDGGFGPGPINISYQAE